MKRFTVQILVTPRPGLLDPQGKAIHHALAALGFESVAEVRVGKTIQLDLTAESATAAEELAQAMCDKLLANPVTENVRIAASAHPGDAQ